MKINHLISRLSIIILLFFYTSILWSQHTVQGIVRNDKGDKLSYASVFIVGKKYATSTEDGGEYILENVPKGAYQLKASYLGYESVVTPIEVLGDMTVDIVLIGEIFELDKIEINATLASEDAPVPNETMNREEIQDANLGQDIPFVLKWLPSITTTSDAGAGIGYTGIRVRGSEASRTNVTINGVPLNDSESQSVFWVNMPDFLSNVSSIQVQRGVGVSTNGTSAFGANVHLNTQRTEIRPFASLNSTIGSYGTKKFSGQVGTGLMNSRFSLDARYSTIQSDGYIDRARSALTSYFISAASVSDNQSLRLNVFGGHEITYQAWNGLPIQFLETDRTYNVSGTDRPGAPYDNEVDNYRQTHYQLIFNKGLSDNSKFNFVAHYTRGYGFFENYKGDETLSKFGYTDLPSDTVRRDVIIERYLDNHFFGFVSSYELNREKTQMTFGLAVNDYIGEHFGLAVWNSRDLISLREYYRNSANKLDANLYGRVFYDFTKKFTGFIDLQGRLVRYQFTGPIADGSLSDQTDILGFFNPKLGFNYKVAKGHKFSAFFGMANREPSRDEYVNTSAASRPKPERLLDTELMYDMNFDKLDFNLTLFNMSYKNQLVPTGQLNDVGEYTRTNVDKSYRRGLELNIGYSPIKPLLISYSGSFSTNKIKEFDEYRDNWLTGLQEIIPHQNTDIAFSPNSIQAVRLGYTLKIDNNNELTGMLGHKLISAQYIDNTSSEASKIPAFDFTDLQLIYKLNIWKIKNISLNLVVNNLLNKEYYNNAWIYRFISPEYNPVPDDPYAAQESQDYYHLKGVFPQATRNFLLGLKIDF